MKVIITGKGGTGKTSIAAALSLQLSESGYRVLVLDADSFPNIARSFGLPPETLDSIVPLARNEELIRERTGAAPGDGWGLLFSLTPRVDDIAERYGIEVNGNLRLVVVGGIEQPKEGCMCPALALAKAFLRHVLLTSQDVVIVDSEAGLEAMGRGLAERFDMNMCVAEPTLKALEACARIIEMSEQLNIKERVLIVNKVKDLRILEKLLSSFLESYDVPFFSIRYDPRLEEIEQRGASISESRDSTFWCDVSRVAKYVIASMRWEKCVKAR
uniref:Adenylyl-sulfate kinase n=1 Tax=Thermofilum pendens TaxID=2269 RepID=A0A7C3SKV5_THEPE